MQSKRERSGLPPRLLTPNMLAAPSLRLAARSLALSRTLRHQYRPTHRRDTFRAFSTTPRRLASEVPDEFINAIKHTALFKKLADKPNALKALSDLYALTKEMGVVFLSDLLLLCGS